LTKRPAVDVAVGVLLQADGRFLLASRPAGKPYAGYWEFPGGKLEAGESVAHALARELREELGIDIEEPRPWVVREFDYPHAYVRLHFCRVWHWRGSPQPHEGQSLRFCALDDLPDGPLLPATVPVLRWLGLPPLYALSDVAARGLPDFLSRLDAQLATGLRLLQFREPALAPADAERAFDAVLASARRAGARVLVSSRHPAAWWRRADGVHLTARDLMASTGRPDAAWVGASTHDAVELARAATLGADLAVLGPVAPTATHPGAPALGWSSFAALAASTGVPLYALGGLAPRDLSQALAAGAHGIAAQRAAWVGDLTAAGDLSG
jgi:8-oxo-dGTP diphosphatase